MRFAIRWAPGLSPVRPHNTILEQHHSQRQPGEAQAGVCQEGTSCDTLAPEARKLRARFHLMVMKSLWLKRMATKLSRVCCAEYRFFWASRNSLHSLSSADVGWRERMRTKALSAKNSPSPSLASFSARIRASLTVSSLFAR